jgi:maltooligosyltrehalose trehalohydrolase
MIDPQDRRAHDEAVLDWTELDEPSHAGVLDLYRRLIALRAAEDDLRDPDLRHVAVSYDETARWLVVHRGALRIAANLGDERRELPIADSEVLLSTGSATPAHTGLTLDPQSAAVVRV